MTYWLSEPIEELLSNKKNNNSISNSTEEKNWDLSVKTLIIGSGYGAAMAALAMAEKQKKLKLEDSIWVFERGNEYVPDDFPKTIADVPGYFNFTANNSGENKEDRVKWQQRLNQQQSLDTALWDIRVGDGVTTVAGNGLGGTSLVNANVAIQPDPKIFQNWPKLTGDSWDERLQPNYSKIKKLLGAKTLEKAESFSKYQALDQTARALGTSAEPVELTINFENPTEHSADHEPCNNCGNCVIGCHSGAKGSLNMNAWPLARQLGVELFTGVTISKLEKIENGWIIHCFESRKKDKDKDKEFKVFAERVILSAGTIGSTEILMRSASEEDDKGLKLSNQLGQRFSTNGDALVFSAGQRSKVNALAPLPQEELKTDSPPGPTIIGKASADLTEISDEYNTISNKFIIEDGAIPYPLKNLWKEIITTQTFIKQFVSCKETAWHKQNPYQDPLASYESFAEHSQILLAMGFDNNEKGELVAGLYGRITPKWKTLETEKKSENYFERLHQALQKAETKGGFDGGHYLPNPGWKPLPDGFDEVVEGADEFPETLISVHPLGGCSMGDSSETGVVNHKGQVFNGINTSDVYEGLYVLDGAILPGAVGVNPFLVISAVSYTLALDIIDDKTKISENSFPKLTEDRFRKIPPGALHQTLTAEEEKISAVFEEELNCNLSNNKEALGLKDSSSIKISELNNILNIDTIPSDARKFIVSIKIFFGENEDGLGDKEQTLTDWLERPCMKLRAEAVLSYDNSQSVHSTPSCYHEKIGTLSGTVCLGSYDKPSNCLQLVVRVVKALCRYYKFRPHDFAIANSKPKSLLEKIKSFMGFLLVGKMHATYRFLEYEFGDTLVLENQKIEGISLSGKKKLAYSSDSEDLWTALVNLPATIRNSKAESLELNLAVDLIKMLKQPSPIQVNKFPNTPSSLIAALSMGGYFLRSVFQTHFWSFGAPSYDKFKTIEQQESPEDPKDAIESRLMEPPLSIKFGNDFSSKARETFYDDKWTRLIRYQPENDAEEFNPEERKSVLLVHGLAHSSRVFWTETIEVNFVQYFLSNNYDVWVIDHRISPNTMKTLDSTITWDDIAENDIPWAVKTVFSEINKNKKTTKKKVHIFCHCIGAGAVAMATLKGSLNIDSNKKKKDSMIASIASHAVTPWLYASKANRARCNVWDIFKDLNLIKKIEPMPHSKTGGVEMIFDRLACAQIDDKEQKWWKSVLKLDYHDFRGIGFPRTIYSRYTIFWGKEWNHENLNDDTRFNFARMIGATPVTVLQQVFYSITGGRLLTHEGTNEYVNRENFQQNWTFPTLFLHGNKNRVFDFNSSKLSADKLTRYRDLDNPQSHVTNEKLTAKDYSDNNVWIELIDNYGHMDVIFGKNSNRDIYPKIHHFFQAADEEGQDSLTHAYEDKINELGKGNELIPHSSLIPSIRSSELPITGPILSRPRKGNGANKNEIRLWVESWDLTDKVPSEFSIACETHIETKQICSEICDADTGSISNSNTKYRPREKFWLLNYKFSEIANERQYFLIQNGGKHSKSIPLDWHKLPWFKRAFDPSHKKREKYTLSFLVGSCFHPGTSFDRDISSDAFRKMYAHVEQGADHLMLLGDQIYADANANMFDPKIPYEKYRLRYRQAFANDDARKLLSNVPVYFAVDDHEFNDNWQGKFTESLTPEKFNYARDMARLFQMHGDNPWTENKGLWYDFETRGFPFFVMDTRFERKDCDRSDFNALVTNEQIGGFEKWLNENNDSDVLFIASGSTIGPISRDIVKANSLISNSDRLIAYPGFLEKIIHLLSELDSKKTIIWLSGDPHFSSLTKCSFTQGDKSFNFYQICSSGIYAPFPFANDNFNNYDWNNDYNWKNDTAKNWQKSEKQKIEIKEAKEPITLEFVQTLLSSDLSHFVRVDLKQKKAVNTQRKLNITVAEDGASIIEIEC